MTPRLGARASAESALGYRTTGARVSRKVTSLWRQAGSAVLPICVRYSCMIFTAGQDLDGDWPAWRR